MSENRPGPGRARQHTGERNPGWQSRPNHSGMHQGPPNPPAGPHQGPANPPPGAPFHPGSPAPGPDYAGPEPSPDQLRRQLREQFRAEQQRFRDERHHYRQEQRRIQQELWRKQRDHLINYARPRPRPDWWPADEQWPPTTFPAGRLRRAFYVRFVVGIVIAAVVFIVVPTIILSQVLSLGGLREPGAAFVAFLLLVGLFAIATWAGRGARRFAGPFGDLIEAAGRVEAGDYSARVQVPTRGWRELRGLMEAFNSMAARLETDEEQRRRLLADVSHELRTPLAVLRGELEAMIDGVHPADQAHLAGTVDQIEMLTKLVEDLRTLALAEAGTLPIHPEPTDVAVLCNEVAASFESLAAEHSVKLELSMAGDLPLVDLDPLRIRQVIGNLVANALRYAPAETAVSIDARSNGTNGSDGTNRSDVEIRVTDRGPGIDPALLPHLFERFTKSEDSRGSGLGLAIARRLVEAHGGTISARSPEAGGTEILVTLPVSGHSGS